MIRGCLKEIQKDNEKEFVNKLPEEFLESIGVEQVLGSPYNPLSQGAVEAIN